MLYAGARRHYSGVGTIAAGFVALVLVLGALLASELDHYAGEDSSAPLNSEGTEAAPLPPAAPAPPVAPSPSELRPTRPDASAAPGGTRPPSASTGPSRAPRADATNQAVLTTVNRTLAALGCDPVTVAPTLVAAARTHVNTMLKTGYLTLEAPDGSDPNSRARASGFTGSVVEVIVLGAESAAGAATIGLPKPASSDDDLPATVEVVARKPLRCGYTSVGADFRRDSRNVPVAAILLGTV
jgi:uncharacterized protein YkwD